MSKNLFAKAVQDAASGSEGGPSSFRDKQTRGQSFRGHYRGRGRSTGRGRGSSQQRSFPHPRSHLVDDDEDIDMDAGRQRSVARFNPYQGRPSSHRGTRGSRNRGDVKSRLWTAPTGRAGNKVDWFKVVILQGKKHDKEWLIRKLQSACEEAFQPVQFHYFRGESAAFFVEGGKVADALKKVSHKITVKDGSKLIVSVRPSAPPHNPSSASVFHGMADDLSGEGSGSLNDDTKQVLKECLSKRYDFPTKTLNLSDMFHDEVLNASNVQGILSRHWMASGIVRLIGENCPELRAVEDLDKIKTLTQLVTIQLDGNPLCDMFQDKESTYINAIRSRFPKVNSLDGHELPPPIGFDLPSEESLPSSKESFLGDPAIKDLVLKFLEQYFKVYDTEDRQGLLEAYHDQVSW
ncbi:nuclear RNA export factor 1-like isoform X4 [Orbicella faveolata]|uniref:nuclear RNA export factor 1-like isoform X4 n=1 Tax=Orbicella faveolata TaxID=48498 RepID=UPI0009E2B8D0|nr:nuclear RNA export factor 1-like isoform X4 [Orbicella faveolata]